MSSKRLRSATAGITLLELLIALAMMAMIGVGLASVFQTTGQVWSRVNANSSSAEESLARLDFWKAIEGLPEVGPQTPLSEILGGGGFSMWYTAYPDEHRQELMLKDGRLVLTSETGTRVLKSDVAELRISYFGRKTVRSPEGWADDWTQATILPRLIRIEAWSNDGHAHPPMALRPALQQRQNEISASSPSPPD